MSANSVYRFTNTSILSVVALEAPEAPQGGARFVIRLKVERAPQEA